MPLNISYVNSKTGEVVFSQNEAMRMVRAGYPVDVRVNGVHAGILR